MLRLSKADSDALLKSPEHGMGYQLVEAVTSVGHWEGKQFVLDGLTLPKGERWRKGIVVNVELLIFEDELHQGLPAHAYERLLAEAASSEGVVQKIRVRPSSLEEQAASLR